MKIQLITEQFDNSAQRYPHRLAFTGFGGDLSYSESQQLSRRVANRMLMDGFGKGTRFALLTPNCGLAVTAKMGAFRAGAVWCNVNLKNPVDDNIEVLSRGNCELVFFHSDTADVARHVIDSVPSLRLGICLDTDCGLGQHLTDWIGDAPETTPDAEITAEDIGMQGSTGGTTGLPKLTQNPHAMIGLSGMAFQECLPVEPCSRNLVVAPITHAAGFVCMGTLAAGGTNVMMGTPVVDEIVDQLQTNKISTLFLPPTLVYMLLQHPQIDACDYPHLKYIITMGAPIAPGKIREAIGVFGPVMCQSLGQTEAGVPLTFISPSETASAAAVGKLSHRLASCGRATCAIDRIAIMDDTGELVATGEAGEIVMQGPGVMKGYLNDPVATAEVQAHGWHHTGDVGYMDDEGYLYINDRKRDMIISGGFNIFPFEIEQVLLSHPLVAECAVVGVADEKWGEMVTGVVEPADAGRFDEEELIRFCRERLGSMKAPKRILARDALPRSAAGKVLKRKIRDELNSQIAE